MHKLFKPLSIKDVTIRNRIVVSPMCQYSSIDGFANDWHLVHLGSRAVGGAGLVMQEATSVSPEGRITQEDMGIWKDAHIGKLQQIASFIQLQGAVAGIQLAHAGRKASRTSPWKGNLAVEPSAGGWDTLAPSAVPFYEGERAPVALTIAGIQQVVSDFAAAAARALKAGYQVIELHGAHGYLIHEFLSPLCNLRKDAYGGSFENRVRLLLEIIAAVQKEWPAHYPLWVRISATDWAEGGWNIDESVQLAFLLKEKGIDLVDCSSGGGVRHQKIALSPGYQIPFAERIRKETGMLTGAVGLITDAQQAEEILHKEQADVVIMAREMLRDPYFAFHAAHALGQDITWPPQYERAKP
ncbi:MAG: NADH:flavin oxidoreductase/NADH oxidase [Sediminibacterium sp.]